MLKEHLQLDAEVLVLFEDHLKSQKIVGRQLTSKLSVPALKILWLRCKEPLIFQSQDHRQLELNDATLLPVMRGCIPVQSLYFGMTHLHF